MDPFVGKGHDAAAPLRIGRPEDRHVVAVAVLEHVHGVAREPDLVRPDGVHPEGVEVVDRGTEPDRLGGGEMIRDVRLDGFTPNELPWKFEAGTMPIAEAVGLGAAVEYLNAVGLDAIRAHEIELTGYAMSLLKARYGDDLTIFGPPDPHQRGGVLSFAYKGIHPHDLSQVLDESGVCIRAGHHCAKPLMRRLGVGATARASFYLYNDETDVDTLADALAAADRLFS